MCLSICFENLLNDHPPKFNKKLNTRQMIDPKPCALIDRLSTMLLPKNAVLFDGGITLCWRKALLYIVNRKICYAR